MAVLDPGDEVVIPAPYWVSYPDMVLLADGVPVMPYAGPEQGYKITPRQLEPGDHAAGRGCSWSTAPATRPVRPTRPPNGARSARCCSKHPRIVIGTDDMYEKIYWGSEPFYEPGDRRAGALRSHGDDQRCLQGLCDDRLAHRLLRGTEGTRHGDGHDPGPVDLERLQHQPEGGRRCAERRPGVRRDDESRVQGTPRLRRRRAQYAARRFLPAASGAFYAFADVSKAMAKLGLADDNAFAST